MDRKAIARETLDIMEKGYYEADGKKIEIMALQEYSLRKSFLLTPEQGRELLKDCNSLSGSAVSGQTISGRAASGHSASRTFKVRNCSTVDAILDLASEGKKDIAVLNFASAKNPGGGFINGAMAQEESLAASSSLYKTLIAHEEYYTKNRACGTMMYTHHAIYSPEVPFFRDGRFILLSKPVTASVLTLPAVNMGQVRLRGESVSQAEQIMRERMQLALAIFASQNCRHLILGAYGCGVFRNDPEQIAQWWKELLTESFPESFETVVFAVLDRSATLSTIAPFQEQFYSE